MYGVGFGYGAIGATTILNSGGGAAYDADAQSFFTASGVTDLTQKNAVNQLVLDLKSNSLWSKMKALYPIVGGNATAHSYNLINTSLYQLSFSSGWTHSANGMTPNGTSAYADTFLTARGLLGVNSTHISYYSRTNIYGNNTQQIEMGTNTIANTDNLYLTYDFANNSYYGVNQFGDSTMSRLGNTLGCLILNRTSSTEIERYFNGTRTFTAVSSTNTPNTSIIFGAIRNAGIVGLFSSKQCSFATIGDGLTSTQAGQLNTIIATFQTSLSRNV
jgi:hypothetical protein